MRANQAMRKKRLSRRSACHAGKLRGMAQREDSKRRADNVVPMPHRADVSTPRGMATSRRPAPEKLWREVLGKEIRRQRTARAERLIDTAHRAGVSPQYLSEVERGRKDPSSEIFEAVAGALGKSSFELTCDTVQAWRADALASANCPVLLAA